MSDSRPGAPENEGVIHVKVRVYAMLRRFLPQLALGESTTVDLPAETTIGDLLDRLGIPRAETKSCFLNGRKQELDYPLKDGDELGLFPPVAGGSLAP